MDQFERATRANAGLNARNDARMIGRGELRKAIKTSLLTLSQDFILSEPSPEERDVSSFEAEGKFTAVKSFKSLLGSEAVQRAYLEDPFKFFIKLYNVINETFEAITWQLKAGRKFLDKYNLEYSDNTPLRVGGTKRRHCVLNLMSAQPVRHFREGFLAAVKDKLGLEFRSEMRGPNAEALGEWTPYDLVSQNPGSAKKRRKSRIYIR